MKISRSSRGSSFSHIIYFSPGEIDEICEKELRKAQMLPDSPEAIDIERFVEFHLECTLDYGASVPDGVLGYTCFSAAGKPEMVGISPSIDDGTILGRRRVRSTFAHEAGHCVLHPLLFIEDTQSSLAGHNIDFAQKRILCRDSDFQKSKGGYDGRWWEYQANCAIGGFLLPKKLVQLVAENFQTSTGRMGLKALDDSGRKAALKEVAEIFDVSQAVAGIRLDQLFPSQSAEDFL
jgi:hypothetical protein